MTHNRLPYSDAASVPEMAVDAHEVEHTLHLSRRGMESAGGEFLGEPAAPASARLRSRYDVPDELAHRADGLELHFD